MLGIHISIAVAWQRASAGDWAAYAADVSHRLEHLRFHRYDQLEPTPDISDLLREIDRDPIAIFWG